MKESPCATGLTGSFAMDQAQPIPPFVAGELGKGGVSAQELNRNSGRRLGCLHERVEASRGSWWSAGGQAQVRENLGNHGGIFKGGEDGQRAAALWTGGKVDGEDALE